MSIVVQHRETDRSYEENKTAFTNSGWCVFEDACARLSALDGGFLFRISGNRSAGTPSRAPLGPAGAGQLTKMVKAFEPFANLWNTGYKWVQWQQEWNTNAFTSLPRPHLPPPPTSD